MSEINPHTKKLTVWMITIPVFIEFLLTFSVFFTDTFFLSRLSDLTAASIGAVIPVFMIFVLLFMMMAQGACAVAAQFLGGGKNQKAFDTYEAIMIINMSIGFVISIFLFCVSGKFGNLLGMTTESAAFVATYLAFIAPSMLLIGVKTAYNSVFASQGKTLWNMFTALLINIVNIAFNLIFVLGFLGAPKLGIKGVALATVASQLIAIIFQAYLVHSKFKIRYSFNGIKERFSSIYKLILNIGIPASIEPISSELGMLALSLFAIRLGADAMATRTYIMNFLTIAICWSAAMAIGNQILVAHRVGDKNYQEANIILKQNVLKSAMGSLIVVAILFFFAKSLMGIFTSNQSIIHLGIEALALSFITEPARAIGAVFGFALKGVGDAKFPTFVGVLSTWLIAIPCAYFLGFTLGLGFVGVWAGLLIDEVIRAIVNYYRWEKNIWQSTGVLAE